MVHHRPNRGGTSDQADWPGIEQRSHLALMLCHPSRDGEVDTRQYPLPRSGRCDPQVQGTAGHAAGEDLRPRDDAVLFLQDAVQAPGVEFGLPRHSTQTVTHL